MSMNKLLMLRLYPKIFVIFLRPIEVNMAI